MSDALVTSNTNQKLPNRSHTIETESRKRRERGRARSSSLFQLLLRSDLVRVATLSLAAVRGTRWETRVALAAHLLLAVVLACEHLETRLDDATTQTTAK